MRIVPSPSLYLEPKTPFRLGTGARRTGVDKLVFVRDLRSDAHKFDDRRFFLESLPNARAAGPRCRRESHLARPSCFCRPFPDPPFCGVFGGKCTTVLGAINMLSAFARVGASLCLLPRRERSLQCGMRGRARSVEGRRGAAKRGGRDGRGREEETSGRGKWVGRTLRERGRDTGDGKGRGRNDESESDEGGGRKPRSGSGGFFL